MAKSSAGQRKSPTKKQLSSSSRVRNSIPSPFASDTLRWGLMALLIFASLITLFTRIRLLSIPMERDEAGFAYIGHWLLHGKDLYVDMVDNKLPGLYTLYAVFTSLFGYHSTGVHIGLLLSNIVSGICFYLLLRELYNRFIATTGTAFFLILMISFNVLGFAAHATQLLMPFVLGGWLAFWKGILNAKRILFLAAGLLLGFAFVIKQQSVVFCLLAALIWWPLRLWWYKEKKLPWIEYAFLAMGGLFPAVVIAVYFLLTDRFDQLVFWSYTQPAAMASTFTTPRMEMFKGMIPRVTDGFETMWIIAIAGVILSFLHALKKGASWFAVLMALVGLGSVVIGAAFYKHYFVLALPGVALLAAIALNALSEKTGRNGLWISLSIAFLILLWPVIQQRAYFFSDNHNQIHQKAYSQNMFPELERIGQELMSRVPEGSSIGIMGSEPGVLVAADRSGCSKHLYMYPLLSDPVNSPPMQQEYLDDMMSCMPEYIVWNTVSGSWTGRYQELQMYKQLMQWADANYATFGLAEFREDGPGVIVWGNDVNTHQSQSDYKVYVFRRQ